MNYKIGIIGYGEIGRSLDELYRDKGIVPVIRDLNREDNMLGCDFIHICIPYVDESFVTVVRDYIKKYKPKHVIVHSTVAVGITSAISVASNMSVCHSPIRGLHPNLKLGLKTFMIYVGTNDDAVFDKVKTLYDFLGIPETVRCYSSETTEMAKLLDTTYYGLCIAFHKEVKGLCDLYGLNFDEVMTKYNLSYNEGYPKLGKSNVVRPVLQDIPGPIGGHCVVPNAKILSNIWKSPVLDLILKYDKDKK